MNGLSTLNRLLGKRNKDVSKSTSNLSRSTTNLDAPSQYSNKVIQLPIVPNAPFEQTFRVTVLLPRDQLYVARVGAKTKLSTLLEQVCNDKLLDAQKYVFRHPTDFQQGFELDMNIGEVGLSEIRLMSRKELEALRNSDYRLSTSDIFRMHQKTARETSGGTSVTSSDLSRTSKMALKTTSPYSSTNSLNSADSSGVSSSSRGGTINNGHAGNGHHQMAPAPVAPARKKRVAPRPPSQNSIPEMRPVAVTHTTTSNGSVGKQSPDDHQLFKEPQLPPYSRQNFHVSTPNLYDREPKPVNILNNNNGIGKGRHTSGDEEEQQRNGHTVVAEPNNNNHDVTSSMVLQQQQEEEEEDRKNLINTKTSYSTLKNRPTSMYIIREPDSGGAALQRSSEHNGGSMMDLHQQHSRASSSCSDAKDPRDFADMPEPTPRKRLNSSAKKTKAPAPPPRAKATPVTPVPTPSPRVLTRSTLDLLRDNDVAISETDSNFSSEPDDTQRNRESRLNAVNGSIHRAPPSSAHQNVSKVMLNVEDAPSSIVSQELPLANAPGGDKKHQKNNSTSSVSIKIGGPEQVPVATQKVLSKPTTPIVSKVQIGNGTQPAKIPPSPGDNSSDEEIKIYNIESGKALIKKKVPQVDEKKPEKVSKPTNGVPATNGGANGEGAAADEEQWTYKLPAPPKFADSSIKANDYDERQQFYRPASTFIDNTTLRSDMLTVVSDETERIEPFIQERLKSLELNLPSEPRPGVESPTSVSTDSTTHVSEIGEGPALISSDVEDGYRVRAGAEVNHKTPDQTKQIVTELHATETTTVNVTHEAREVWLQTLEKRREKIIEGELATLSESIGGKQITVTTPPVGPPAETVNERKSSVMNELNQLLRDGVELNHKEDADIVAANRSSLANFKISTYSSENKENIVTSTTITTTTSKVIENQDDVSMARLTSTVVEKEVTSETVSKPVVNGGGQKEEENDEIIARRKTSLDTLGRKAHSLTQSSDEDDPAINRQSNGYHGGGGAKKELAPVKRRSLTMLNKSPRVINRSDSFHSTRSDYIQALNSPVNQAVPTSKLQLTPRSTSYISLIGAQRWENRAALGVSTGATSFNRRKSTSELSICDSPSLQSLEVIKNILNTSRKNSINNLHHTASSAVEQRATLDEDIALPSMAAIKRNSFTDISTLGQLNGKLVQLNGVGGAAGSIRKDSIEEVKIEQEEEHEKLEVSKVDEGKAQIERTVEVRIEKLIVEEQHKEEKLDKRIEELEPKEQKQKLSEKTVDTKPKILMEDLASESKSDDEKLQNKQHQQQSVKEPQTSVVSITTTSTVVSSTNSTDSKPSNDTDTKKWTYQGPPTISFATWNERPKIDVSIKSDRDYRFGGSSTLPRGFRNVNNVSSTKISIGPGGSSTTHTTTTMTTMSASETAVRRTIHEVEPTAQPERFVEPSPSSTINVPLTVPQERPESVSSGVVNPKPFTKPSKPASSGSSLTTINSTPTPSPPPGERLPIVRAVEYKKNVASRQSSQPVPPPVEPKPSYFYETFSRNDSTTSSTNSSIGTGGNVSSVSLNGGGTTTTISRLSLGPKPATLLQPTVRGFKSLDEATIGSVATPARLRPVSMIDTSAPATLRKTSVPVTTTENDPSSSAPNSLPFSQNTLRRTGLKEKILAKEEVIVSEPVSKSTKVNDSTVSQELNAATTAAPSSAPKRPVSLAGPIPPPPSAPFPPVALKPTQPVVRGAIVKKSPTSPAIDPRTALLDAIRGFNKDSLRK
uniref:Putative mucin-17 n=1 Tax=Anopheles triannulatus TaxID=58253 RepID=A0A2M3ZY27_9DIPT